MSLLLKSFESIGLPARLPAAESAQLLGFASHDIPFLVSGKLLKPLGNPAPNAPKYFATCELLKLSNDRVWLDKATKSVTLAWKRKNQSSSKKRLSSLEAEETFPIAA